MADKDHMQIWVIIIAFSSLSALADCRFHDGKRWVSLPDGHRLSLHDEGGSLSSHRVQDQDGLGTCYANATSAVLKSVLPENPDVSYTDATLQASSNGWQSSWRKKAKKYVQEDGDDFTSGGFICETIAAMKRAGGACPKKYSVPETKENFSAAVQENLLEDLGAYFDQLNSLRKRPKDMEKFKADLARTIDSINFQKTDLIQNCEEQKKEELPLAWTIGKLVGTEALNISTDTECGKAKLESLKKLMGPDSVLEEDRMTVKPTAAVIAKFKEFLEQNPELKAEYLAVVQEKKKGTQEFFNSLGSKFKAVFLSLVPPTLSCPEEEQAFTAQLDDETYGEGFVHGVKLQLTAPCIMISRRELLNRVRDDASNQCIDPARLDLIVSAAAPLLAIGRELDEELLADLTSTDALGAMQLKNLLTPGCQDKNNRIPLDDVACASFTTCDESAYNDYDNSVYEGPAGGCYGPKKVKAMLRLRAHKGLKDGKALGLNVCTAFMDDPTVKTKFCKKVPSGLDDLGLHAMALSGYRCVGEKIEYEVLNSWGTSCPEGSEVPNSPIKCELNEQGMPNGRFWVSEDLLLDNVTSVTQISKRGKK